MIPVIRTKNRPNNQNSDSKVKSISASSQIHGTKMKLSKQLIGESNKRVTYIPYSKVRGGLSSFSVIQAITRMGKLTSVQVASAPSTETISERSTSPNSHLTYSHKLEMIRPVYI